MFAVPLFSKGGPDVFELSGYKLGKLRTFLIMFIYFFLVLRVASVFVTNISMNNSEV